MKIYGPLEKIELFRDENSCQFVHVTYKMDLFAYLALTEMLKDIYERNKIDFIENIQPAETRLQPDNSITPESSPLVGLPDNCLVKIFERCDIDNKASLSLVCTKFQRILKENFFDKMEQIQLSGFSKLIEASKTICRIIECKKETKFKLVFMRGVNGALEPTHSEILAQFGGEQNELCIDIDLYRFKFLFENISNLIEKIVFVEPAHYVCTSEQFVAPNFFRRVKEIQLYMNVISVKIIQKFSNNTPNVTKIHLVNGRLDNVEFVNCIKEFSNLTDIYLENCTFPQPLQFKDIDNIIEICKNSDRAIRIWMDCCRNYIDYERNCNNNKRSKVCESCNAEYDGEECACRINESGINLIEGSQQTGSSVALSMDGEAEIDSKSRSKAYDLVATSMEEVFFFSYFFVYLIIKR